MPPTRTKDQAPSASTSSTKTQHDTKNRKRRHPSASTSSEPATPGVSKLKAALRQTRRLLAKDTLAADVRVDTERRLKALEADLKAAEATNKERTMAEKYHMHRFFDKKKILRLISRTKKRLTDSDAELSKKEKKALEKELYLLRVDLNYIIHYPKSDRYISLFPPEVRQSAEGEAPIPVRLKDGEEPRSDTEKKREEVRKWVKEGMEGGELRSEPEVGGAAEKESRTTGVRFSREENVGEDNGERSGEFEEDEGEDAGNRPVAPTPKRHKHDKSSASKVSSPPPATKVSKSDKMHSRARQDTSKPIKPPQATVAADDFFGEDSD